FRRDACWDLSRNDFRSPLGKKLHYRSTNTVSRKPRCQRVRVSAGTGEGEAGQDGQGGGQTCAYRDLHATSSWVFCSFLPRPVLPGRAGQAPGRGRDATDDAPRREAQLWEGPSRHSTGRVVPILWPAPPEPLLESNSSRQTDPLRHPAGP